MEEAVELGEGLRLEFRPQGGSDPVPWLLSFSSGGGIRLSESRARALIAACTRPEPTVSELQRMLRSFGLRLEFEVEGTSQQDADTRERGDNERGDEPERELPEGVHEAPDGTLRAKLRDVVPLVEAGWTWRDSVAARTDKPDFGSWNQNDLYYEVCPPAPVPPEPEPEMVPWLEALRDKRIVVWDPEIPEFVADRAISHSSHPHGAVSNGTKVAPIDPSGRVACAPLPENGEKA